MPTNIGSQTVHVKFFDPVTNPNVNFMALDIRKIGIYRGGYLTKSSNTLVSLSTLSCEISDANATGNQVRITTGAAVSIVVSSATPLVVLRWTYTADAAADYMDFVAVAVGAQLATDVIVGKCLYSGSTLTDFDYTLRTNPLVFHNFLKVEPTDPASMFVRIRAGRINYGVQNFDIVDSKLAFAAPGSNSYIGLVQVTAAGAIKDPPTYGSIAVTPTPPIYGGLFTAAEITLTVGQTTITEANIKDVRSFVSNGTSINAMLPTQTGYSGYYLATDGSNILWAQGLPTITGNNGKFLRVNSAGTGVEWAYVTYAP